MRWGLTDATDEWAALYQASKTALICAKVLLTYVLLMSFPRLIIGVIGREKLVNNVVTGHGYVMVARIVFGGESNIIG